MDNKNIEKWMAVVSLSNRTGNSCVYCMPFLGVSFFAFALLFNPRCFCLFLLLFSIHVRVYAR